MKKYISIIDKLNIKAGKATSYLAMMLVLVVSYDVIVRYILGESSVGLQELEWHIFSLIFLLSAGYTLHLDEHVRVDVIYTRFTDKTKAWINFLGCILFLIPFCVMVIIASYDFVEISFRVGETSPDAGGLPARFILKAVIPISFLLIFLQGTVLALKSFIKIRES